MRTPDGATVSASSGRTGDGSAVLLAAASRRSRSASGTPATARDARQPAGCGGGWVPFGGLAEGVGHLGRGQVALSIASIPSAGRGGLK